MSQCLPQMGSENKKTLGCFWVIHIGDYITQVCGDHNKL